MLIAFCKMFYENCEEKNDLSIAFDEKKDRRKVELTK